MYEYSLNYFTVNIMKQIYSISYAHFSYFSVYLAVLGVKLIVLFIFRDDV